MEAEEKQQQWGVHVVNGWLIMEWVVHGWLIIVESGGFLMVWVVLLLLVCFVVALWPLTTNWLLLFIDWGDFLLRCVATIHVAAHSEGSKVRTKLAWEWRIYSDRCLSVMPLTSWFFWYAQISGDVSGDSPSVIPCNKWGITWNLHHLGYRTSVDSHGDACTVGGFTMVVINFQHCWFRWPLAVWPYRVWYLSSLSPTGSIMLFGWLLTLVEHVQWSIHIGWSCRW